MPEIQIIDEKTITITVTLEDAIAMVTEASRDVAKYAEEIIKIYQKMPEFEYTFFCFYAYDTAVLFEHMLGIDPKKYTSFALNAPDSFFYALFGGMAGLQEAALQQASIMLAK
jgi:hypothetical protein